MRDGFDGQIVRVAKVPKVYGAELIRTRDQTIERMTAQGRSSREIGVVLGLNPVSVRRIRSRLAKKTGRKVEERQHVEASRVG